MNYTFISSSSPHIKSKKSTSVIMRDVVISLLPAIIASIYFFRIKSVLIILVAVFSCILAEYISNKILKKDNTLKNFSAVVTGILLAFNLPPTIPLWIAFVGGFFAIIIAKQLFGGLGHNFINPALAARAFLMASWPSQMTNWINPVTVDATSTATPLGLLKESSVNVNLPQYYDLFIGNIGGCLGETSALALIIGALYLIIRKVITLEIPLTFIITTGLFTFALGGKSLFTGDYLYHILSGGLILGAFFMATDYTTSPTTKKGKYIMGIGCGLITSIIRLYGGYPEGVSFSILLMNLLVPIIDKYTIPKSFGGEKNAKTI